MFSNCCKTYYKVKLLRMKKVGRKENSRESKSFMIVVMIIVMMKTMNLQVKKMTLRLVLWFCNKHTNLQYIQFFGYSKYVMVYKLNTAFISLLVLGYMYFILILVINMIKTWLCHEKIDKKYSKGQLLLKSYEYKHIEVCAKGWRSWRD